MEMKISRRLLLSCWIATVSASDLPAIIWYGFTQRSDVSISIPFVQFIGFCTALLITTTSTLLRPARGFIWALIAFTVGGWVSYGVEQSELWIGWTGTLSGLERMSARTLLSIIPIVLMSLSLLGSGIGRRELFLAKGNLAAPSKMPFRIPSISWKFLGPLLTIIFILPLIVQLTFTVHPVLSTSVRVTRALPLVLVFALANAASEEFRFRSVLLGRIQTVVGPGHGLLLTSTLFGLAHWFGHPSGPTGVLMAGFAGWFWGKAMLETKGLIWSWIIHAIQDVAIATFIVMSSP